jgi:tetratricopeptide (TPR) repeat protein
MRVELMSNTRALLAVLALVLSPLGGRAQDTPDSVQQLYEQAKSDEQAHQLDMAVEKYLQIISISPTLTAAYNNLGRLYFQQGEYAKSVQVLEKACKLDPRLPAPHALLGFSYFQMGNFEGARRELEISSRLDPANAQVKLFLARSLVQLGDLSSAVKILDALQQKDPNNIEVLYTLGFVYSDLAELTLQQMQKADPTSYLVELVLGKAAEAKQVYTDAATHYKNAIDKSPDNWELYYRYGHVLYASGELPDALKAFQQSLSLNPFAAGPAWEAARILVSEKPGEAYELVNRSLNESPDMPDLPEALSIRGRALLALHRSKEAIEDLKKACNLDQNDASCHFSLAQAYRQAGLNEESKREFASYERLQQEAHQANEQQAKKHVESTGQSPKEEPAPQPQ